MSDPVKLLGLVTACSPLVSAVFVGVLLWGQGRPSERPIMLATRLAFLGSFCASVALAATVGLEGRPHILEFGSWYTVGGHRFELTFLIDRLSILMMLLTSGACSLIGHFSITYLHNERGFARFFLLLNIFAFGMLILVMAGSVDFLFVGWELVGVTSALLIAFFHERREPVLNGLRAFLTYRTCDLGLLVGTILLHHYAHEAELSSGLGTADWVSGATHLDPFHSTVVALLFLVGAMGKSAQVPFSGWLPRAMEGPTPSSPSSMALCRSMLASISCSVRPLSSTRHQGPRRWYSEWAPRPPSSAPSPPAFRRT